MLKSVEQDHKPLRSRKSKLAFARKMRREAGWSERTVEAWLTSEGVYHKHQVLLLGWIPDFYLPVSKTVIEIDGSIHETEEVAKYDRYRDEVMRSRGFRVFRYTNEQVLETKGACAASAVLPCDLNADPRVPLSLAAKEILKQKCWFEAEKRRHFKTNHCDRCGTTYPAYAKNHDKVCPNRQDKPNREHECTCKQCGEGFVGLFKDSDFCTSDCTEAYYSRSAALSGL